MNNNGNIDNSRVKKVIEPKFQHKYISIILPAVFFIVFAPFIWMLVTTLFDAENTSANKSALVIVLLVVLGILAGIGFLGKWIGKRLIKVYLYDKGFQTNKDNQEYYYKNLEYFYIPGVKKILFQQFFMEMQGQNGNLYLEQYFIKMLFTHGRMIILKMYFLMLLPI